MTKGQCLRALANTLRSGSGCPSWFFLSVRTGLGVFSSQHGVRAQSVHIFSKFQDNDHAVVSASMGKARGHGRTGWMTD